MAISDILRTLCQSCDGIDPSDIVDVELNCSGSDGRFMYLTAGLVYSTPDSGVTASTLINRLLTWLLSEDTPSILVQGTPVGLNKQCPTQLNAITRNSCLELLDSDALTDVSTTKSDVSTTKSDVPVATPTTHLVVGFFAGLLAGVVITALIVALIIW
jgi:hypothetical protein